MKSKRFVFIHKRNILQVSCTGNEKYMQNFWKKQKNLGDESYIGGINLVHLIKRGEKNNNEFICVRIGPSGKLIYTRK